MTRVLTISLALAIAVPFLAEEPKKSDQKTASTTEQKSAQTINVKTSGELVPAQPVTQRDSPLVAAAKRANRLGKKPTNLITNETLAYYGKNARITIASANPANLPPPGPPPAPTPEMQANAKRTAERKKAAEAEARAKKLAEERERNLAHRAAASEEGLYDSEEDDPATSERDHGEAAKKADEKPPEH